MSFICQPSLAMEEQAHKALAVLLAHWQNRSEELRADMVLGMLCALSYSGLPERVERIWIVLLLVLATIRCALLNLQLCHARNACTNTTYFSARTYFPEFAIGAVNDIRLDYALQLPMICQASDVHKHANSQATF